MSVKTVAWPNKITLSRGPKGKTEYSTGGEEGENVEVPQLDETLSMNDFTQSLVNLVGNENDTKAIINRKVLAEPAIREGQQKFKSTHKKGSVKDLVDATKEAILAIRDYVPQLAKERGAFIAEATKAKDTMDNLRSARAKVASGEMTQAEYFALLESALAPATEEAAAA